MLVSVLLACASRTDWQLFYMYFEVMHKVCLVRHARRDFPPRIHLNTTGTLSQFFFCPRQILHTSSAYVARAFGKLLSLRLDRWFFRNLAKSMNEVSLA